MEEASMRSMSSHFRTGPIGGGVGSFHSVCEDPGASGNSHRRERIFDRAALAGYQAASRHHRIGQRKHQRHGRLAYAEVHIHFQGYRGITRPSPVYSSWQPGSANRCVRCRSVWRLYGGGQPRSGQEPLWCAEIRAGDFPVLSGCRRGRNLACSAHVAIGARNCWRTRRCPEAGRPVLALVQCDPR